MAMLSIDPYPKIDFIEDIQTDLIFTTLFEDLGAPKGIAGMVDWRLNGFISHTMLDQKVHGTFRECTLMPLDPPFQSSRLCIVGLGSWRSYNSLQLKRLLPMLLRTIMHLKPTACLVCIPKLLKESYKNETQAIVSEFFSEIDIDIKIDIQTTPIA
ncbi:MAG: hypothetical protein R3A45_10020 [Bdellovibrionota bacterium]|nr:hypothetical protein [Deltaproteobacteria bacterium]